MSLTSIIKKNPDIKNEFPNLKSYLTNQMGKLLTKEDWKSQIRVPSIGASHEAGHIGTTFDYVARSVLSKQFDSVVPEDHLIAEGGLHRFPVYATIPMFPTGDSAIDEERKVGQLKTIKNLKDIIYYLRTRLTTCIANRDNFLVGKCDLTQVIIDAAFLAKLEATFRAGSIHVADYYFKETEGKTYFSQRHTITEQEMLGNVSKLVEVFSESIEAMPWQTITLNPSFGSYSETLEGADADFIADNCVVDIKSQNRLSYNGDDFAQLLGYAAMASMTGFKIRQVAIYYARFGLFAFFDLSKLEANFLTKYWSVLEKKVGAKKLDGLAK